MKTIANTLKKNSEKFQNRPGCLRLYDTAMFSIRQQYKGDCRAEVRLLTPISVTQAQILKGFGKPVFCDGRADDVALLLESFAAVGHTDTGPDSSDHFDIVHAVSKADSILNRDAQIFTHAEDAASLVEGAVDQFAVQAGVGRIADLWITKSKSFSRRFLAGASCSSLRHMMTTYRRICAVKFDMGRILRLSARAFLQRSISLLPLAPALSARKLPRSSSP